MKLFEKSKSKRKEWNILIKTQIRKFVFDDRFERKNLHEKFYLFMYVHT